MPHGTVLVMGGNMQVRRCAAAVDTGLWLLQHAASCSLVEPHQQLAMPLHAFTLLTARLPTCLPLTAPHPPPST